MYSTAHRTRTDRLRRHSRRHRRRRHRPTNRRARFLARSLRPGGRSLRPSFLASLFLFPLLSFRLYLAGEAAPLPDSFPLPPSLYSLPWSACPVPSPPYRPSVPVCTAREALLCFSSSSAPCAPSRARDAVPCWVLGNEASWWVFRYSALRRTSTAPKLWMGRNMGHNSSPQFAPSVLREGK